MRQPAFRRLAPLMALVGLALFSGCDTTPTGGGNAGGESPRASAKRIVLLTNGNSPYWDACREGMQQGAAALKLEEAGLTAIMEVNDGTPQGQIDKLRQLGAQADIVGVAVSALDADNAQVADEMKKLRDRGIHVICVDADVNRERFRDASRQDVVGADVVGTSVAGTAAGKLLAARGVNQGSYAMFVGRTGSHNAIERMGGINATIGEFREAERAGDDLDRTRARDNVRNAMQNHPDLVALLGIWSYNAPAIVDVVSQEEKRDKFTIVTFDAEPIAIRQMGNGDIDAMVVQNPFDMGYQGVRLLKALIEKDEGVVGEMFPRAAEPEGDLYDTGLKLIVGEQTPLTTDDFAEFGGRVQIQKLGDFQQWLTQNNLTGS